MRRPSGRALLLLAALTLAGCSSDDGPPKSPTCDTAQSAVDEAQRQAEIAIAALDSDPATAQETLTGVQTSLAASEADVSTAERTQLQRAHAAIDSLLAQATGHASGEPIDGETITQARADLLDAVSDIRADC